MELRAECEALHEQAALSRWVGELAGVCRNTHSHSSIANWGFAKHRYTPCSQNRAERGGTVTIHVYKVALHCCLAPMKGGHQQPKCPDHRHPAVFAHTGILQSSGTGPSAARHSLTLVAPGRLLWAWELCLLLLRQIKIQVCRSVSQPCLKRTES
eukprot:1158835-Pelagomonas_calceolata.AAC.6